MLIIGTCTGAGLATARRAKGEGAQLILTDRRAGPLEDLADEIGVEATAAFDESDVDQLRAFLDGLPGHVDHVLFSEIDLARAYGALDQFLLPICIARYAQQEMRDCGSLMFIARSPARRPGDGQMLAAVAAVALPAIVANLAVEAAPVRVNLITCTPADDQLGHVAARAVQLMVDPAVTGAILDLS
ncbi:hypothetical protein ACQPZX_14385 [Actinoplanes sp. CA-142083]|uniref:hypothetical protein n=1 Tax=Actinoplanes sp. CA-142083 TaxID=3239903 RepID=UPI003D8FC7E1